MSHYETMPLNYKKQQKNIEFQKNIKQQQSYRNLNYSQKQFHFYQQVSNFDQDQNTDQFKVFDQQKNINIPFLTFRPKLIQSLLPFKEKMIQQMKTKKQLFLSKIIKNKLVLNQQCKFYNKEMQDNQSNEKYSYQKSQSQKKMKKKVRLRKKSSYIRPQEQNRQAQLSNIETIPKQKQIQFVYLSKLHDQQSNIMNRLLDIIQKDKEKSMYNSIYQNKMISLSSSASKKNSKQNSQKAIIINNYMKPTPQGHIEEELRKKQLAIKFLQIERQNKRNNISSQKISRINNCLENKQSNVNSTKQKQTQLSLADKNIQSYKKRQCNEQIIQNYKGQTSFVNEFVLQSHNEKFLYSDSNGEKQQIRNNQTNQIKDMKLPKKQLFMQLNLEDNQYKAKILQNFRLTPVNQIIQHNQSLQKSLKTFPGQKLHQKKQSLEVVQSPHDKARTGQQRRPVLIQIPLSQNQNISLSLADAFKKKMKNNKLATQKRQDQRFARINKIKTKKEELISQKNKQNIPESQRNHTLINLTDRLNDDENQFLPSQKLQEDTKRTYKTINPKKHVKQIKFDSVQSIKSSVASPRQPSKQLLERLIYGSKAKIDKKQMYALTKKNYERLPQVQNKRKMQEKKLKQLQRLQKMKDFQRQIRSSKTSLNR